MREPIKKSMSYPYKIHFKVETEFRIDKAASAFARKNVLKNGRVKTVVLKAENIRGLRKRMHRVLKNGEASNFVATFAVGGIFPLNFIARCLEKCGSPMILGKYHLFAGLNWSIDGFDPKQVFLSWLDSLPSESQIVLFDTGNYGNAGGQLFNLIKDHYRNGNPPNSLTVHILIIATKNGKRDKTKRIKSGNGNEATVDLKFLWVTDNPFEDAVHFIGYESLRPSGEMKPQKFSGRILVQFKTHKSGLASADIAAAFMDLFVNRLEYLESHPLIPCLE
jgi:hypothetical protein